MKETEFCLTRRNKRAKNGVRKINGKCVKRTELGSLETRASDRECVYRVWRENTEDNISVIDIVNCG